MSATTDMKIAVIPVYDKVIDTVNMTVNTTSFIRGDLKHRQDPIMGNLDLGGFDLLFSSSTTMPPQL